MKRENYRYVELDDFKPRVDKLYPLADLLKGQLDYFSLNWVKIISCKYPFVE